MTTLLLRTLKAIRQPNHSRKGFTLIELLIVTLIAGGIVSGLMFLVVELLSADQRDASRNATQQDMQRSMEYISSELREAIFVYSGDQLNEIRDNIPASLSTNGSTPVLAFWKQAPLPSNVLAYCASVYRTRVDSAGNALPIPDAAGRPVPCAAGHAYSLVVYSLNTADDSPWTGKARLTRYELRPYNNNSGPPAPVPGYVSPIDGSRNLFASWPLGVDGRTNRQTPTGTPTGAAVPLTDFVDDLLEGEPTCPSDDYNVSPSNGSGANLPSYPYSFYACVYTGSSTPTPSPSPTPNPAQTNVSIDNQEVVLYLRGNGFGRPSINAEDGPTAYRPSLTTRVFNRGTLDINPNN